MIWTLRYPIRTARLELRPHVMGDLDDLVVFHGDPEVTRFIPWPVRDREATRAALEVKLAQEAARAPGEWIVLAIVERSTGTVIGEVLLKRGETGEPAEVGYVIRTDRQGLGLASEAVRGLLDAASRDLGVDDVIATLDPRNAASVRLLERLGFAATDPARDGVLTYRRTTGATSRPTARDT